MSQPIDSSPGRAIPVSFRLPDTLPSQLPLLPLRQGVVLPGGVGPLTVGRPSSVAAANAAGRFELSTDGGPANAGLIVIAVQRRPVEDPSRDDLLPVGVLARVIDGGQSPGRPPFVVVHALARVSLGELTQTEPYLMVDVQVDERGWPDHVRAEGVWQALREQVRQNEDELGLNEQSPLLSADLPRPLWVDAVSALLEAESDWKLEMLLTADPLARAEKLMARMQQAVEVAEAREAVRQRISVENRGHQKEMLLRQQLRAIQEELGDADSEMDVLRRRLEEAPLPEEVRTLVNRELTRLDRLRDGSPERSVSIDWLHWVVEVPWDKNSAGQTDLGKLEAALDKSHFGLDEVKRQVVEHLAVRSLAGSGRGDVLLLVGPPGVGKTSIGQAIADATGRKLVRVALGGVRDESEIRGHRRTYVGARPGRIVEGIRRSGTSDPVILLDEIDKLGKGWQGDPGAALLELLDPEQNHSFTDHYLELPLDMSRALFVATANDLSGVPGPLRDRMEVLRIDGYTIDEKVRIIKDHLLGKLLVNAGLAEGDVAFTDDALEAAVTGWTREAGVRSLQRTLGRVFRAAAVQKAKGVLKAPLQVGLDDLPGYLGKQRFHDEDNSRDADLPGVATGLAWTPVGGDVLTIEAAALPGTGQLVLTGQLGDVMKESARAALTYVLSHAAELGIDVAEARRKDIHIHVPAGAVPKDGPSAGVTMFTALASLLSGRPVRPDLAMTGEATLRGRVLPVGGIRSKVLAAHRQGIKCIILPRLNGLDLDEVSPQALAEVEIILVDRMDEVLRAALGEITLGAANSTPKAPSAESVA